MLNLKMGGDNINVYVKLFGMIDESIGYKEIEYEVAEDCTINNLISEIKLPVGTTGVIVTVNGEIIDEDTKLNDRDELLVLPVGEKAYEG